MNFLFTLARYVQAKNSSVHKLRLFSIKLEKAAIVALKCSKRYFKKACDQTWHEFYERCCKMVTVSNKKYSNIKQAVQ